MPQKADEPPTPAELVIDEAIDKVAKLESVSADIEQRVDMLNQHVSFKGRYLKAPQYRVYFRLTVDGPARDLRRDPPGLRRRDAVGLPGHPQGADLLQVQRQAGHGTAQFARARSQDEGTDP